MNSEHELIQFYLDPVQFRAILEEGLRADQFGDPEAAAIFQYTYEYVLTSGYALAPTKDLLLSEFENYFKIRGYPEEEYLLSVLIAKIKNQYKIRHIQSVVEKMSIEAMSSEDPGEALTHNLPDLQKILINTSHANRQYIYTADMEQRLEDYFKRKTEPPPEGIFFGWEEINQFMGGIRAAELLVLAGTTGLGKSFGCAKIGVEAAMRSTDDIIYLASLENDIDLTIGRADCMLADVSFKKWERGLLSEKEERRLREAMDVTRELIGDRLIIDTPKHKHDRTIYDIYARARYHGASMLVGDQLSWVTPLKEYGGSRTSQMEEIINDILECTTEGGIASVWASQFNRDAYKRKGGGGLENMALSSSIEQGAAFVCSIHRTKEMEDQEKMIFDILKGRRTGSKAWLMDWKLADTTKLSVIREYVEEAVE